MSLPKTPARRYAFRPRFFWSLQSDEGSEDASVTEDSELGRRGRRILPLPCPLCVLDIRGHYLEEMEAFAR